MPSHHFKCYFNAQFYIRYYYQCEIAEVKHETLLLLCTLIMRDFIIIIMINVRNEYPALYWIRLYCPAGKWFCENSAAMPTKCYLPTLVLVKALVNPFGCWLCLHYSAHVQYTVATKVWVLGMQPQTANSNLLVVKANASFVEGNVPIFMALLYISSILILSVVNKIELMWTCLLAKYVIPEDE